MALHVTSSIDTRSSVRTRGGGVASVLGYHARILRSFLASAAISQTVTPVMYLLALGVGLGKVIDRNGVADFGVDYLVYLAPGLVAATGLQLATSEATFPIIGGFFWRRTYFAMNATPLTARQICLAQLARMAIQIAASTAIYLAVIAAFGAVRTPWAIAVVPLAVLGGMAFGTPVAAYAATLDREGAFLAGVWRFLVMPMFLFSGTFYPVESLPKWAEAVAWVSPLWHATELCRWAAVGSLHLTSGVGELSGSMAAVHLGYLVALALVGTALTMRQFRVRLAK